MTVEVALTVLKISRETWLSIPKTDRERIIKAVRKGAYGTARGIYKTVVKRRGKTKKRSKSRTKRRRKRKVEWWQ